MTEIDLTPVTRLEYDIDAILNDHAVAEPITRIELILADIVAGNTTTVEPVTRIETYLAIISGADYPVPEPVTRIETFLAIIAGEDYETPEAVTRLEGLLAEWVEKGSGIWKTVTGTLIHITDALASPVKELSVEIDSATGVTGCDINCAGADLYDHTYEKAGYLQVDGNRKTSSSWAITYYIEVSTGNYVAKGLALSGSGTYICVYDSGQTFLRSVAITANAPVYFTIANGEKYIRMSVRTGSSEYETAQLLKYDIHAISWQTEAGSITSGTLTIAEDGSVSLETGGVTHQLESITPISALAGENNIWADVNGEITLIYKAQAE